MCQDRTSYVCCFPPSPKHRESPTSITDSRTIFRGFFLQLPTYYSSVIHSLRRIQNRTRLFTSSNPHIRNGLCQSQITFTNGCLIQYRPIKAGTSRRNG